MQFYGPPKTVQANWEYAKERMAQIPGATFRDGQRYRFPLSPEEAAKVPHKVVLGIPNMAMFMIGARSPLNPTPQDGHLWFAPVIPRTGEAVFESQQAMSKVYRDVGINAGGPLQLPQTWHPRTFIMLVGFPLSRSDPRINKRSREAFARVWTDVRMGSLI